MYFSLDSVDIGLEPRDGRERCIQTDWRSPAEMLARPALSTIIVLIRCLNPRRMHPNIDLFYNCRHEPPPFMIDALKAAGGHLWVGEETSILFDRLAAAAPSQAWVDALANAAMAEIASEIMLKYSSGNALSSLGWLELETARAGFPDEDNPVTFWTTIVELGALAAEAIRANHGGAWTYDTEATGVFPLTYKITYKGEPGTANPLGKALKFIRGQGGGDQPSALVRGLARDAK